MGRLHKAPEPPVRHDLEVILDELPSMAKEVRLAENATEAYRHVRSEADDVVSADSPRLAARRRELLLELEAAERELRIFRAERRRREHGAHGIPGDGPRQARLDLAPSEPPPRQNRSHAR